MQYVPVVLLFLVNQALAADGRCAERTDYGELTWDLGKSCEVAPSSAIGARSISAPRIDITHVVHDASV
jgi:hypothetical protein